MLTTPCRLAARRAFMLTLCMVALVGGMPTAHAETASNPVASAPAAQAQTAQEKFVQQLGDHAITILSDKSLSEADRNTKFLDMLRNAFDLPTIARFVIGRNSWATATPEQQKEYLDLFEKLVVKTYSERFALYTGEGFKVRSATAESDLDTVVNSDITHPDGSAPTSVTWRVRTKGDKMGVIDVVVEGVSMSVTQRQEYASVIQRNGGDVGALLALMRERIAQQPATKTP